MTANSDSNMVDVNCNASAFMIANTIRIEYGNNFVKIESKMLTASEWGPELRQRIIETSGRVSVETPTCSNISAARIAAKMPSCAAVATRIRIEDRVTA